MQSNVSHEEKTSFPNDELPEPSERSNIAERLRILLSVDADVNLFKLSVYIDYKTLQGKTYTERIEVLVNRYFRAHQTIKNIITEMKKMEKTDKNKFQQTLTKLKRIFHG